MAKHSYNIARRAPGCTMGDKSLFLRRLIRDAVADTRHRWVFGQAELRHTTLATIDVLLVDGTPLFVRAMYAMRTVDPLTLGDWLAEHVVALLEVRPRVRTVYVVFDAHEYVPLARRQAWLAHDRETAAGAPALRFDASAAPCMQQYDLAVRYSGARVAEPDAVERVVGDRVWRERLVREAIDQAAATLVAVEAGGADEAVTLRVVPPADPSGDTIALVRVGRDADGWTREGDDDDDAALLNSIGEGGARIHALVRLLHARATERTNVEVHSVDADLFVTLVTLQRLIGAEPPHFNLWLQPAAKAEGGARYLLDVRAFVAHHLAPLVGGVGNEWMFATLYFASDRARMHGDRMPGFTWRRALELWRAFVEARGRWSPAEPVRVEWRGGGNARVTLDGDVMRAFLERALTSSALPPATAHVDEALREHVATLVNVPEARGYLWLLDDLRAVQRWQHDNETSPARHVWMHMAHVRARWHLLDARTRRFFESPALMDDVLVVDMLRTGTSVALPHLMALFDNEQSAAARAFRHVYAWSLPGDAIRVDDILVDVDAQLLVDDADAATYFYRGMRPHFAAAPAVARERDFVDRHYIRPLYQRVLRASPLFSAVAWVGPRQRAARIERIVRRTHWYLVAHTNADAVKFNVTGAHYMVQPRFAGRNGWAFYGRGWLDAARVADATDDDTHAADVEAYTARMDTVSGAPPAVVARAWQLPALVGEGRATIVQRLLRTFTERVAFPHARRALDHSPPPNPFSVDLWSSVPAAEHGGRQFTLDEAVHLYDLLPAAIRAYVEETSPPRLEDAALLSRLYQYALLVVVTMGVDADTTAAAWHVVGTALLPTASIPARRWHALYVERACFALALAAHRHPAESAVALVAHEALFPAGTRTRAADMARRWTLGHARERFLDVASAVGGRGIVLAATHTALDHSLDIVEAPAAGNDDLFAHARWWLQVGMLQWFGTPYRALASPAARASAAPDAIAQSVGWYAGYELYTSLSGWWALPLAAMASVAPQLQEFVVGTAHMSPAFRDSDAAHEAFARTLHWKQLNARRAPAARRRAFPLVDARTDGAAASRPPVALLVAASTAPPEHTAAQLPMFPGVHVSQYAPGLHLIALYGDAWTETAIHTALELAPALDLAVHAAARLFLTRYHALFEAQLGHLLDARRAFDFVATIAAIDDLSLDDIDLPLDATHLMRSVSHHFDEWRTDAAADTWWARLMRDGQLDDERLRAHTLAVVVALKHTYDSELEPLQAEVFAHNVYSMLAGLDLTLTPMPPVAADELLRRIALVRRF